MCRLRNWNCDRCKEENNKITLRHGETEGWIKEADFIDRAATGINKTKAPEDGDKEKNNAVADGSNWRICKPIKWIYFHPLSCNGYEKSRNTKCCFQTEVQYCIIYRRKSNNYIPSSEPICADLYFLKSIKMV